jgi:hypothetical protein
MNPTQYQGCHVLAIRTRMEPPDLLGARFLMELRFGENNEPLRIRSTHVGEKAQVLIAAGDVTGVSTTVVEANSLTASLLGQPHNLLTSVQLRDGSWVNVIPAVVQKMRRFGAALSVLSVVAATAGFLAGVSWPVPAAIVLLASHAFRTFLGMPSSEPFEGQP